jgi:hypothetical protein
LKEWLNFAGLSLDFLGVMLLANEWRIAIRAEQREAEIAEREMRLRPNPMMPRPDMPNQAVFDYMRENQRLLQQTLRARSARNMRRNWFTAAMLLIALGFLLQMVGSWPLPLPF